MLEYVRVINFILMGSYFMKANEKLLIRFLESSDTNFVIPVYQRNYNWQKEQCKQLYDDCVNVIKNNYSTHFFGTIVSIYNENGRNREYLIIDGQQRVTTISLMLLAIYNILKAGKLDSSRIIKEKIMNQYLINQYLDSGRKLKLRPIKDDRSIYENLFESEEVEIDSNMAVNYEYFYKRILKEEVSIDEIYSAIEKLIIVEIELKNGEDDPQLIFESLNSTGLDLTDADKVRNFILMGQNFKEQEELYNDYWNKVEKNTHYRVSNFIRDYMTMKENRIPNISKVYINFKRYIAERNINIRECLNDMLAFSGYYRKILTASIGVKDVDERIKRINKLGVTVLYPFLLEVLDDYFNSLIDGKQLLEIVEVLESYIFRRIMCSVATSVLGKVFMTLGKEIKKYKDYPENYVEILKYILINKKSTQKFPNDKEFESSFHEEDIYSWKSKNKIYLLERLENHNNKERVDIDNLIANRDITIEHIMPQELNMNWKIMLGDDFKGVHEKYLHTIGNLTLTGYNPSMSNKSFNEKKTMEKGFKDSRLKLNKYLLSVNKWDKEEIEKRSRILFNEALSIWEYPKTNYKKERPTDNLYSLADEDDFTNTKVASFILMGDEYKVKNWTELYEKVCITLFDFDSPAFFRILNNRFLEGHIQKRFSHSGSGMRAPIKISDNVYVEKHMNTEAKISMLRFIFDEYNLDYNELIFFIK